MVRIAAAVLALAGLTVLASGVVEAVPLVFWGTADEHASADHGRTAMLIGAALTLVAAAATRSVLLAVAALLPTVLVLATPGTAFGVLILPVAIGLGVGGAIALFARGTAAA